MELCRLTRDQTVIFRPLLNDAQKETAFITGLTERVEQLRIRV